MKLLEIVDLAITFTARNVTTRAVNGVSLTLDRGEVLGIVGESGSGKSLSAMAVIDLLPPGAKRTGSVFLDGQETSGLGPAELRRLRGGAVGTIFQDPLSSLNPVMTIGAQLVEAIRLHDPSMDKARMRSHAASLLDRVGIINPTARLKVYPHELSGGMRQRVMIAMAIANSPALLIADEPTTALDVTTQVQVLRTLQEVRAESDAAMILISHDLGVISDVADRVAVMYHGRIIETGPTASVLAEPQHPYTAGLLRSRPRIDLRRGSIHSIPGSPPRPGTLLPGCSFAPRCARASEAAGCWSVVPQLADVDGDAARQVACFLPGPQPEHPENDVTVSAAAATETDADAPVLTVAGLTKVYRLGRGRGAGQLRAVDDVTFELGKGRTLALVGESGCGKTTAARSLLRLVEPTAGEVRVAGDDVRGLSRNGLRQFRTRAQLVFQDPTSALNPRQTVGDLIAEPMVQHGVVRRRDAAVRVAELLELVALDPVHAARYPNELSGGQRQRVAIARAVGLEPDVLVLDEPVSALDVSIQAQVLRLLTDLQSRLGIAFLFISHDLGVVRQLADVIAVMYLGRIVEIGPAAEVLDDPWHPYTQLLVASVPGRHIDPLPFSASGDTSGTSTGCGFANRCPLADDRCRTVRPDLVVRDDGTRRTACHRHELAKTRYLEAIGQ